MLRKAQTAHRTGLLAGSTTEHTLPCLLSCRWIVSFSSAITPSLQLLLVDDSTKQEVACLEGPCLFRMHRAEQYQIFIDNSQQGSQDHMWVRLVIASALLMAKQEKKVLQDAAHKSAEQVGRGQKRRSGQRFALNNGNVTFEI